MSPTIRSRRRSLDQVPLKKCSHAGLALSRYLEVAVDNNEEFRIARADLYDAARNSLRSASSLYAPRFEQWKKCLSADCEFQTAHRIVSSVGRLALGLGNSSVLENGLTLHHTYGTPVLPGTSLKGLAAHFCHQEWGSQDEQYRMEVGSRPAGESHEIIFGSTRQSGLLTFHDALVLPESLATDLLHEDIITTHHGEFYSGEMGRLPTDFDEPNPVSYLTISGEFLLAVQCPTLDDAELANKWAQLGMRLLTDALTTWGIGGKTSTGYGLFDRKKLELREQQAARVRAELKEQEERQAALAEMSPLQRSIEEYISGHPNKSANKYTLLIEELRREGGRWTDDGERREVAREVEKEMKTLKKWDHKSGKKHRAEVEKILGEQSS